MSDPTRWRDEPADRPAGADLLLRAGRRPRPPRPEETARLDAVVDTIARQASPRSARRWSPTTLAAAAALAIAAIGGGAYGWRAVGRRATDDTASPAGARRASTPRPAAAPTRSEDVAAEVAPSAVLMPAPVAAGSRRRPTRTIQIARREPAAPPPQAAAAPTVDADALVRETALVDDARRNLAAAPGRALAALDVHRREFAQGQLAAEREFLAIEALRVLGRTTEARARAAALQAHYPSSSYAARALRLLREDATARDR